VPAGVQPSRRSTLACTAQEVSVLLVVAIVLLLLFAGLGFVAHVLWLGLILAVIVFGVHLVTGRSHA
jgi:hypothetical protein